MHPSESERLLTQLLARQGFDPRRPDPQSAWEAFKDWVYQRTNADRETLVVTVGWFGEDETSCIEFRRVFQDARTEEDFDLVLGFYSGRSDAPRLAPVEEHSEDATDLRQFFDRVERLPGFGLALRYPYWECELGRA